MKEHKREHIFLTEERIPHICLRSRTFHKRGEEFEWTSSLIAEIGFETLEV